MRISSAYMPTQTGSIQPTTRPVPYPPAGQRQVQTATGAYNKNSTAQVIDAEYVEFYTPSNDLNQERHNLDNTLEAEPPTIAAAAKPGNLLVGAVEKYQLSAKRAAERPGTLLNIYA